MTWLAYTAGALAASQEEGVFGNPLFWIDYLCLFLLEVVTVLTNELADLPSDRSNRFFSTFTGGSRVLVEGLQSRRELSKHRYRCGPAGLSGQCGVAPRLDVGESDRRDVGAGRDDDPGHRLHRAPA